MTFDQFTARLEEHLPRATIAAKHAEVFAVWTLWRDFPRFDPFWAAASVAQRSA